VVIDRLQHPFSISDVTGTLARISSMALELSVAQDAIALVTPFLPFLASMGQTLGESVQSKLTEVIAENGGNVVWETAEKVWHRIAGLFQGDRKAEARVTVAVDEPADQANLAGLVRELAKRLEGDAALVQDLQSLMGGSEAVQKLIVGQRGRIIQAFQEMAGKGEQTMKAGDDGLIRGAKQRQGFEPSSGS
jgi:hypothetical protein